MIATASFTITIRKDEEFEVDPVLAEVLGGSTVVFAAVDVTAKVYIPAPVLIPIGAAKAAVGAAAGDELIFEVAPGKPMEFQAVDENALLEYFVTRQVFGGFTEAVAIPPQMIIKKLNR
ncbi:MAG: hypothetical protein MUC56_01535 [Thermoanaerobaculales bacterium]|jgi:hypothetical protein|nr:hypothetical protein [Thermoanaerobaculales bacterium]